jgi:uncharacterized protein
LREAAMPRLPDDAQLERLAALLEQRAVPFKGFNLEALDGYLSALVASPAAVAPSEWQPPIWGRPPRWSDEAERDEVDALLQDQWQLALQRACYEGDDLPEELAPLLWLPEDPDAAQAGDEDALDVGRDWAFGFFRGVELREAAWEHWLDAHDWIDEIFQLLDQLASGEVLDGSGGLGEDGMPVSTPLGYRQRLDIIASLPGMLADLQRHRIDMLTPREPLRRADVPERNAPCPCGSGRKFKKCCGA